jgi:hypothetical protein
LRSKHRNAVQQELSEKEEEGGGRRRKEEKGGGRMRKEEEGGERRKKANAWQIESKGTSWLQDLRTKHRNEVQKELSEFKGVGQKVADCVALFSLDKLDVGKVSSSLLPPPSSSFFLLPPPFSPILPFSCFLILSPPP